MLTDFFDSAARIQAFREGPAGPLFEAFAHALAQGGYAEITARRHLDRPMLHLCSPEDYACPNWSAYGSLT
jgi:hypothetical protein